MTRTINNIHNGVITDPICLNCAYTLGYNWPDTCEAFPKGIPQGILDCTIDHTKPVKGDGGKQFFPLSKLTEADLKKRLDKIMADVDTSQTFK